MENKGGSLQEPLGRVNGHISSEMCVVNTHMSCTPEVYRIWVRWPEVGA
jgi:hypothetical protein